MDTDNIQELDFLTNRKIPIAFTLLAPRDIVLAIILLKKSIYNLMSNTGETNSFNIEQILDNLFMVKKYVNPNDNKMRFYVIWGIKS
ncbi:hypothetical protein [Legionella sp. 28fT52]|uniref:hypothetical protein n=1 Tax=Legionella sp. 28fT52 TaxID=3410134 RepID=UPI003AF9253B